MVNQSTPLTPAQLNYSDSAIFKAILKKALTNFRSSNVGIIEEFDSVRQVVTIQIAITEIVKTLKGPVSTPLPLVYNVPIVLPRGGGFCVTLPLTKGDECALLFSDMGFDLWWARGGVQSQIEPRRHDITDAICIPGPWNQTRVISSYSSTSLQIRSDNGQVHIELTPGNNINLFAEGSITLDATSKTRIPGLSAFLNNAAAVIGGLVPGDLYRSTADPSAVCVVF